MPALLAALGENCTMEEVSVDVEVQDNQDDVGAAGSQASMQEGGAVPCVPVGVDE